MFLVLSFSLLAKPIVTLYVYHMKAPYIVDLSEQTGLYFDVADVFNRYQQQVTFQTHFLPRKRLDKSVEDASLDGLVMGVNPIWFGDLKHEKYLWTSPIFEDTDDFVSFHKIPFEYEGETSLHQKTIGGILGYKYFGVDELAAKDLLTRVNTNEEIHLLDMLLKQRLDVAIVSRSTRQYLEAKNHWLGLFHVSEIPHDRYTRHIMALRSRNDEFEIVAKLLENEQVKRELNLLSYKYQSP